VDADDGLRTTLGDKLSEFEALPLLEEIDAAVVQECGTSVGVLASSPGGEDHARENVIPADPQTTDTIPYTSPLSSPDLARLLRSKGLSAATDDAVDAFLRRHRDACPDCFDERDRDDRRRNEPKYLYHPEVWPALIQHFTRATDES
jgi:hypothetical protein